MKSLLSLLAFAFLMSGCIARQIVPEKSVGIQIKQHPCKVTVVSDGDDAFSLDGTLHNVNCDVEVDK